MGGQGHDLEAYRIPVFVLLPVAPFSVHPLSSEPLRVSGYTSTPSLDAFQAEGTRIHAEGHLPLTKKSVARAQGQGEGSHALPQVSFAVRPRVGGWCVGTAGGSP